MNGITHLLTGYLVARAFKRGDGQARHAHDSFPAAFTSIAAILPDLDSSIGIPHAQATHTILGGLLLAMAFTGIVFAAGFPFLHEARISTSQLLAMAVAGVLSHLVLDIFTYYGVACASSPAHVYLWPLWGQSFHLDCILGATPAVYLARVLIEWAFYSPFLVLLLIYKGVKHKEWPYAMLCPRSWLAGVAGTSFSTLPRPAKVSAAILGILCVAVVAFEVAGVILFGLLGIS